MKSCNVLDLKNPFFRYTGQQPQPPPGNNHTSPSEAYWNQHDLTGNIDCVGHVMNQHALEYVLSSVSSEWALTAAVNDIQNIKSNLHNTMQFYSLRISQENVFICQLTASNDTQLSVFHQVSSMN